MIHLLMAITVAILAVLGVLLMILETFVPGMVAGILGALCVLASVALIMLADDFATWPGWLRATTACAIIVGSIVLQLVWLRYFAVKFWHRTFTLQASVPPPDQPQFLPAGTEGVALTELRPLGRADFQGMRREVRCEDGFAPQGSRLRVTGSEPGNLIVRLIPTTQPTS
ncbi:NfeD-like C-terminal, partner-binding [Prosthecobacter debontii]|uniref:NfeD-like C-terminal, partner-binding n=1 Tax=Prosthecobacter debontii TaxID=48467 RepID=A0A1T4XGJ1_9BACT|nr:NfeD family protein [Prosthecobacter debontii]SKA88702.1 NfeD-like C-terminal, partner-binding [Prosthecobacter debontii]